MKYSKRIVVFGLLSATLLTGACTQKNKDTKPEVKTEVPTIKTGLKIAYYNMDSLKTGYSYYAHIDSSVTAKQLAFQKELQKRQMNLQSYADVNGQKADKGLLSAFEIQKVQEEIQRRQQSLYEYQQVEGDKIDRMSAEQIEVLSNRIHDAAEKYCKEKKIDMLMMQAVGSGITYIDSSMNVTDDFIDYLNQYQKNLEKGLK